MVIVPSSVPEEQPLNVGECLGDHLRDFCVEVAESGHGLWLSTEGEVGNAHSFQQGLQCVGHTSSAGKAEQPSKHLTEQSMHHMQSNDLAERNCEL
jgi:hypothetical protein